MVDTGGLEPSARDGIFHAMARQTLQAVDEADVVLFLVDGRDGLDAVQIARSRAQLRQDGRKLLAGGEQERGLGARQRSARNFTSSGSASRCRSRRRTARACAS